MGAASPDAFLDDLCRAARLRLDPSTRAEVASRLLAIMESFAELRTVADASPPQPDRAGCALREDTPQPCLTVEAALSNAKRTAADCFVVPRVVEG
jgi:aspartyl/glutamyl-tRNA(Asn/Gln) amidotransferase C subunit